MDWLAVALLILLLYLLAAAYIKKRHLWDETIAFYGPVMAIKTRKVGFLDRFRRFTPFFRIYGSVGIVMVVVVSVLMTALVFFAFHREVVQPPQPEGIYSLPNILALPGVNQFIPFTVPVILAIIITIAVHELGHGVLCRVEGIPVKSMGALIFVIPIGFFVEPDEEELNRTAPVPKSRMFGAGIMNNLVACIVSFAVVFLLIGLLVPVQGPVIYQVVEGSPAANASLPLGSSILSMNGKNIASLDEARGIIAGTRPGDTLAITVIPAEQARDIPPGAPGPEGTTYTLSLSSYPGRTSGYAGIIFSDPPETLGAIRSLASPLGSLFLTVLPVDLLPGNNQFPQLHLLFVDSPDMSFYRAPFVFFWGFVHFFFWCGWFNFMVGTFNALPMIPFDGGYIMKEGVEGLARRLGRPQLAEGIVLSISLLILVLILLLLAIPYIAHALGMTSPGL